ncbi:MAG: hydroxymethylpyrimidine/phosphomethylpyrimidine kinase [Burkholderiales bacterium]|jgi:hydroxymethylpyrimidine/phosphomethylpyrimidine kinase|nr:hydroxymethylpyrimidine/phosphomethylpyrimidine kinase [Burkholderiales bacterium]MCA3160882.1 hydroxymethylpyrimidine/phosphomethylpyrimidine kinase [Burkholderiales bacterium]MCA3163671.1 hydroxymethylpyrimidine/phosphomethylpyrimidine kinase [Burkholderiales bacterium]MCA3166560.1 hydroxymethylpyrimidine/phosphomethylpyrimidine kinase [Burkholderiales bacterium]MCA3170025.1 hydroxymethylpyrimidine/phosphomethylpyrimidine kinase [Burkholderiales bacterium]
MTSGSLPVAAFEQPPLVLTFAASDPTSGAGLQADLLTIASLGCHGTSVLTGITVQDSAGVDEVMALDADWVDDQARTLLEDMSVSAFKLGVLCSAENVRVIAEIMSDYPHIPLVFDPVLASGRGDSLSDEEVIEAMRELLLPQATIVTPNSLEARRLAATDQDEELESLTLDVCAQRLLQIGAEYVLITGTHEVSTSVTNRLFNAAGLVRADEWQRLPGSYHGSGCTLASAIAAMLALGADLPDAVQQAQEYTWNTLAHAFRPGMGQAIPDRFFWSRQMAPND